MTTTFKVECSHCGKDLTSTGNCEGYRLDLKVSSLPSRDGFVTMMAVYPPLKQDENFCGIACLRQWLTNNHPDPAERRMPPASDVLSYGGVTLQSGVTTTPVGSETIGAVLAGPLSGTYSMDWSFSIAEGAVDLGVPPSECRQIIVRSEPCRRIAIFEDGRQIASNEMARAGTLVCSAAVMADGVKRYRCEIGA